MTARDAVYGAYAALALGLIGLETWASTTHRATLGQVAQWCTRRRAARVALLLGWAWLGWHLFARGSAAFLTGHH